MAGGDRRFDRLRTALLPRLVRWIPPALLSLAVQAVALTVPPPDSAQLRLQVLPEPPQALAGRASVLLLLVALGQCLPQ
jgi:hypothetical protein